MIAVHRLWLQLAVVDVAVAVARLTALGAAMHSTSSSCAPPSFRIVRVGLTEPAPSRGSSRDRDRGTGCPRGSGVDMPPAPRAARERHTVADSSDLHLHTSHLELAGELIARARWQARQSRRREKGFLGRGWGRLAAGVQHVPVDVPASECAHLRHGLAAELPRGSSEPPEPPGSGPAGGPVYVLVDLVPAGPTRMWGDVKTVDKGTDLRARFGPATARFATPGFVGIKRLYWVYGALWGSRGRSAPSTTRSVAEVDERGRGPPAGRPCAAESWTFWWRRSSPSRRRCPGANRASR